MAQSPKPNSTVAGDTVRLKYLGRQSKRMPAVAGGRHKRLPTGGASTIATMSQEGTVAKIWKGMFTTISSSVPYGATLLSEKWVHKDKDADLLVAADVVQGYCGSLRCTYDAGQPHRHSRTPRT